MPRLEQRLGGSMDYFTGTQYEQAFLGSVDVNSKEFKQARSLVEEKSRSPHFKFGYYVNYPNSVDLVERFQPIDKESGERVDPTESQKLLQDIKYELAELIGVDNEDILAFTAIGSPLDHFHGIDAYVKIKDKNGGKPFMISFDITLKRDKDQQKADILISNEIPDPAYNEKDEKEYLKRVSDIAKQAAAVYNREVEERKRIKTRPRVQVWSADLDDKKTGTNG